MASERIIKVTDGGELRLYEDKENGRNFVALKAPSDIVSDYEISLPAGQGTDGEVLTADGAGGSRWGNSDATLNTAYHTGAQISADSGQIEVLKTDDTNAFHVYKSATGAGAGYSALNTGTGACFYGDQTGTGKVAHLVQEAPEDGLYVNKSNVSTGIPVHVDNAGTGVGIQVDQVGVAVGLQVNQTAAAYGIISNKTNVGAEDALRSYNAGTGDGIHVEQIGVGKALHINQTQAANAIHVEKTTGAGTAVAIDNAGSGVALTVANTSTGKGVQITQIAGGGVPLEIVNSASAIGETISQAADFRGLQVVKSATGSGSAGYFQTAGTDAAITGVTSNASSSGVSAITSVNGNALQVLKSGDGSGVAMVVTNLGTGSAIAIINAGTGHDIYGTSDTWHVTPGGHLYLSNGLNTYGLSLASRSRKIASDAITIDGTYSTIYLTVETTANDDLATITGAAYDGQIIILVNVEGTYDIAVKDGTGNISCISGGRDLTNRKDRMMLQWDSTLNLWCELSFANNA